MICHCFFIWNTCNHINQNSVKGLSYSYEPQHEKMYIMTKTPSEAEINLRIHAVLSVCLGQSLARELKYIYPKYCDSISASKML